MMDITVTPIQSAGDCTRPVEIKRDTRDQFSINAALRGLTIEQLIAEVLNTVADDDLFGAVLDD